MPACNDDNTVAGTVIETDHIASKGERKLPQGTTGEMRRDRCPE
jgi:hypothetical protein